MSVTSIKFQNILGIQAFILSNRKCYQTKLVQNVYISSVLKVRSQFAVRFMEYHEQNGILYETPFRSEQTLWTIYKTV